jgi:hypothetical protein
MARPGDGNELLVTGASRKPAWQAMTRETAIVTGITALALLITAACTTRPRDCAQIEPLLAAAERSLKARFAASDLDGVYKFSDAASAPATWWVAAAPPTARIPSDSYRASTVGSSANTGGANTLISPTFANTDPNAERRGRTARSFPRPPSTRSPASKPRRTG